MIARIVSASRFVVSIAAALVAVPFTASAPAPAKHPTVLLISIDAFRWDYPEIHPCPEINKLIKRGVHAEGLVPCYPSYTFPNHYSIVTGLRPETHGIVSNDMYDPLWNAWFHIGNNPAVREGRWWAGEPIWLTATRQGRTSASYYWPGSEADIRGEYPTWWHVYDGKAPFEARLGDLMTWLTKPADERPAVVTFYFSEVDWAGHTFGPTSPKTGDAVAKVDAEIGRIVDSIATARLTDEVDIIIVSDHGMADSSYERAFDLTKYLGPDDAQIDFSGSWAGIRPKGLTMEQIVAKLKDASPHIHVYRKNEIPERLHFRANRRIPDVLLIADEGWQIDRRTPDPKYYEEHRHGSHGYDNALKSMHGVFIAAGPSFEKGRTIPEFENIDIYNLMCAIAGLQPAPNEGDDRLVRWLLKGEKP